MAEMAGYVGFVLIDYVAMILFAGMASRYSESVLDLKKAGRKALLPAAAMVLMWMVVFSGLPVMVVYLFLYSMLLLYFLLSYDDNLSAAMFASGTFMFHVADLYMMLFGIFSLLCDIETMETFQGDFLYLILVLLVLLSSMVSLEIFNRMIDKEAVQILIRNKRQIRFAATSLMFIDIYLLILSIVYDRSTYTSLMLLFLVITSILLFGAFYTSFIHAVRMSVLEMYESRFKDLESQLEQSNRSLGKLKDEAYTDALTGVASRRYGLLDLDRMLQEKRDLSACLIDLDGLKAVNDTLGHQEGDRYLKGVARVLRDTFGARKVCRLGGDEFLAVLPGKTEQEVEALMEAACRNMEEAFRRQGLPVSPSVSYGVAEAGKMPFGSVSDVLELADRRMYEMKKKRHKTRQ